MIKQTKTIIGLVLLALILVTGCVTQPTGQVTKKESVKIGIITDLTGPAAYWGTSTAIGAELAAKELREQGFEVELIFEDYKLSAKDALTGAQKLVSIDDVDAIYSEFNPGAIATGSFVKDKDILHVYAAAIESPLEDAPYTYKTYIDYKEGCKAIAQKFKEEGKQKIGMLKVTLEFGDLCLEGAKQVYGDKIIVESYNLGDADLKTQTLKLKTKGAEAIISTGFEGDTLAALKAMKELDYKVPYGTVADTLTEEVKELYSEELKGAWSFGFKDVSGELSESIIEYADKPLESITEYAVALAYTHTKQIVKAISECDDDMDCVAKKMDSSEPDSAIGFEGFEKHIAEIEMEIKQY